MANPLLRFYAAGASANITWTRVHPDVPVGRALVIGKLIVACEATCTALYVEVREAGVGAVGQRLIRGASLGAGESYEVGNIVIPASSAVWFYVNMATAGDFIQVNCVVSGEEVDNVP